MQRDPISGNEIPVGGTPKGVRDDIDANIDGQGEVRLSEGEFIIPANVTSFYGPDFFEDLIENATDQMEELGIGDKVAQRQEMGYGEEESPDFTEEELMELENEMSGVIGFASGGLVKSLTPDADDVKPVSQVDFAGIAASSPTFPALGFHLDGLNPAFPGQTDVKVVPYIGPKGEILNVVIQNGKVITRIPEGFKPQGEGPAVEDGKGEEEEVDRSVRGQQEYNEGPDEGEVGRGGAESNPYGAFGGKNPYELTRDEIMESVTKAGRMAGLGNKGVKAGAALNPFIAGGSLLVQGNSVAQMKALAEVARSRGDKDLAAQIDEMVDAADGEGIVERIFDKVATGKGIGNRWKRDYLESGGTIRGFDDTSGKAEPTTSGTTPMSSPRPEGRDPTPSFGRSGDPASQEGPRSIDRETSLSFGDAAGPSRSTPQSAQDFVSPSNSGTSTRMSGDKDLSFGGPSVGERNVQSAQDILDAGGTTNINASREKDEEDEQDFGGGRDFSMPSDPQLGFNKGGLVKKRKKK